jgi:hypothetical protein
MLFLTTEPQKLRGLVLYFFVEIILKVTDKIKLKTSIIRITVLSLKTVIKSYKHKLYVLRRN